MRSARGGRGRLRSARDQRLLAIPSVGVRRLPALAEQRPRQSVFLGLPLCMPLHTDGERAIVLQPNALHQPGGRRCFELEPVAEIGVSTFVFYPLVMTDGVEDQLEKLATEILPRFKWGSRRRRAKARNDGRKMRWI